jgi:DNA-binding NtrC family response regulator
MSPSEYSILIIDDHEATLETLSEVIVDLGHTVTSAQSCEEAKALLHEQVFDLVLSDLMLPDGTGLELMETAHSTQHAAPFVVITGHGSIDNAIEATRLGAYEYLTKPLDLNRLRVVIRNALHQRSLEKKISERGALANIIGQSPSIVTLKEHIQQVARTDATVLIQGESGTGKELVARAFQALSDRRDKPFVVVNLAALPRDLLESELFGHEKGAFTGAVRQRKGRFELSDGGTLFLDEIGEMPLETQVKLLRVLQEREFERVGGMEPIRSDFRLIAATNADLKELIQKGQFREDLYFRINVVSIRIPPLRERREDIPLLVNHFLQMFNSRYNTARTIGRDARQVLERYHWPGNVRELENAIERAVVTSTGESIEPDDLPEEVRGAARPVGGGETFPPGLTLDEVDKRYALAELQRLGGNKTQLAKSLGIGLKTLYRKLEAWDEEDA